MKNLKLEYELEIKSLINYSDEQLNKIKSITTIDAFGRVIEATELDQERFKDYYTWDGIEKQIQRFEGPVGLLYYISVEDKMEIRKIAVQLDSGST